MSTIIQNLYRTYSCGELNKNNINEIIKLSGWIFRKRSHGGIVFIDLRDHYGLTQLVLNDEKLIEQIDHLRVESVIFIEGKVVARSAENANKNLKTGDIEVIVEKLIIESAAAELPLQVDNNEKYNNDIRWRYRFLDLRREEPHKNIILRSKFIQKLRQEMISRGFMEFQTPILTASSPEGARDFLVPSRVHPGKFYALPQAPQQFKQLLMVSGFDKYFQIAPCFRDEDSRADRSPGEFYQLDIEMSFVTQEDIFQTIEPVIYNSFKEFSDFKINSTPFPKIKYKESMLKYGSDKPDLRNPLLIDDVTEIFDGSSFGIFAKAIAGNKAIVRGMVVPGIANLGRAFCDKKNEYVKTELKGAGLGYMIFECGEVKGPIAKNLGEERIQQLREQLCVKDGDVIFFACDEESKATKLMGEMRKKIAEELNLINKKEFIFCWVVDFPMYELNDGIEISSGAIRNHKPEIMYKAFEIAGYSKEAVDTKFSGMINAFKFGAPPHGGIAPGVDRMIMLIADEPNIREIIAFPLNQAAQDLMMSAPSIVSEKQLKELHLKLDIKEKK